MKENQIERLITESLARSAELLEHAVAAEQINVSG